MDTLATFGSWLMICLIQVRVAILTVDNGNCILTNLTLTGYKIYDLWPRGFHSSSFQGIPDMKTVMVVLSL